MSDGARVTIRELAAALNRKLEQVEAEAAALGMFVGPDWSGQPSLPVADAKGLASGEARRNLKDDRAWNSINATRKRWVAGPSTGYRRRRRQGASDGGHPRTRECLGRGPGCRH